MPAWGTTFSRIDVSITSSNFNPRARVGHDRFPCCHLRTGLFQSTCPRGARHPHPRPPHQRAISIHVPAWGTTTNSIGTVIGSGISIHVPTWGTTSTPPGASGFRNFNPRARVGHDLVSSRASMSVLTFQSTCPRGARPIASCSLKMPWTFQSTCPRGARQAPS